MLDEFRYPVKQLAPRLSNLLRVLGNPLLLPAVRDNAQQGYKGCRGCDYHPA
jgi:hypothetical protein